MTEETERKRVLISGTGLVESILAAALSRTGVVDVVHIDQANVYGGSSVTVSLNDQLPRGPIKALGPEPEWQWHAEDDQEQELSRLRTTACSSRLMLDRRPQLIFADGEFLKLLIRSKCYRYLDLSLVQLLMHGSSAHHYQDLMLVPLSKEDVFTNRSITLVDKRRFMKFLSTMRPDNSSAQPMDTAPSSVSDNSNDVHENAAKEPTETINCTLREALDKACLTEGPLGDMIIYSIAHQPHAADMPWDCAKQRIEQFIRSVGRYGKSPFLLAHYGAAELCQAFCRLSAVFGGVYMLNHSIASVNSRDDENGKPRLEVTLTAAGAEATVETVDYVFDAASSASLADNVRCQLPVTKKTARGILITTAEPAELCTTPCLIVLTPPSANERLGTIFWLRVGADTCHAAEGFYINYFWAQCIIDNTATTATATTNVRDLLMPLIKPLFSTDDNGGDNSRYGRLLASIFYWDQDDDYLTASSTADWSRVSVAESSSSSVDVDWAVREARRHYEQITEQLQLRREEFLPSPPDQPDDDDDGECNY